MEFLVGERPGIGVDDLLQWRPPVNHTAVASDRTFANSTVSAILRIVGVQHLHVLETARQPEPDDLRLHIHPHLASRVEIPVSRRHDDELAVDAAAELDELVYERRRQAHGRAAGDEERAVGGPYSGAAAFAADGHGAAVSVAVRGARAIAEISRTEAASSRLRVMASPIVSALAIR